VREVQAERGSFTENLKVGTIERPTGVTIFDTLTGEPYCLQVAGGVTQSVPGACVAGTRAPVGGDSAPRERRGARSGRDFGVSTPEIGGGTSGGAVDGSIDGDAAAAPKDTEPPVITIIGNNPAEIALGSTYSDPGAIVTDNVSKNLGLMYEVDGVSVRAIEIDTSAPGEHAVTYRATDQAANSAEATRIVRVFGAEIPAPAGPGVSAERAAAEESAPAVTSADTGADTGAKEASAPAEKTAVTETVTETASAAPDTTSESILAVESPIEDATTVVTDPAATSTTLE